MYCSVKCYHFINLLSLCHCNWLYSCSFPLSIFHFGNWRVIKLPPEVPSRVAIPVATQQLISTGSLEAHSDVKQIVSSAVGRMRMFYVLLTVILSFQSFSKHLVDSSFAEPNPCLKASEYGCYHGMCWKYCGTVKKPGNEWCFTSKGSKYKSTQCRLNSDCNSCWPCRGKCEITKFRWMYSSEECCSLTSPTFAGNKVL